MTRVSVRPWFGGLALNGENNEQPGIEEFRLAMRQLAGAVTLVTSQDESGPCGLTATAVCSMSAEPPRILCCINLGGRTYQAICKSRYLAINVLQGEQVGFANDFASRSEKTFDTNHWTHAATGAPILREALVSFDCAVAEMFVMPTHALIVGEIRHIAYKECPTNPLIYQNGEFLTFSAGAASVDS
ncbi:flavin reductase (DIM6/NTAB) family NADH-FMN oxidoreductase RutF [Pseudomonas laurylsulfatiphila]|uniref:flavin reductase family protein n=1 Tax=Pseudomonas laurylsulfatiphila TaxID=2011015 RepID=UPI003D21F5C7